MDGERVIFEACGESAFRVGKLTLAPHPVGFLDTARFLPPPLPAVDGFVGLAAFREHVVLMRLACDRIDLLDAGSARRVRRSMRAVDARFATGTDGTALTVLLPVSRHDGRSWFLLDSGNLVGIQLRAKEDGGWDNATITGTSLRVSTSEAQVRAGLLYDGVLDLGFARSAEILLDLSAMKVALRPAQPCDEARD